MKKNIALTLILLLAGYFSYADGYWLELKGSGLPGDTLSIRIRYGGVDEAGNRYLKKDAELDKMNGFRVFIVDKAGRKEDIVIKQYPEYWGGNFIPREKGIYRIFAIDESLPIVERPDSSQSVKPVQYLCAAYRIGRNDIYIGAIQRLDLQVEVKDKIIRIVPFVEGRPVSDETRLRVFYPDNHSEMIPVGKEGVATLSIAGKGLYLIRLDRMEGRVRHRCDYSLQMN